MADDETDSKSGGQVGETINAITGLVKAVPVYEDALQPAAKEVGRSLQTVAKAVNVALAPVSGLVWGYEQIKDFVDKKVSEKLQKTSSEDISTPPPHVAGPALESLKYTGSVEELRELYANLLASSIDLQTTNKAHPSFVEIIKQLSSDEAKILQKFLYTSNLPFIVINNNRENGSGGRVECRFFNDEIFEMGLENQSFCPTYIDNLCRLGLLETPPGTLIDHEDHYARMERHPGVHELMDRINKQDGRVAKVVPARIDATSLGRQFIDICVKDHREHYKNGN